MSDVLNAAVAWRAARIRACEAPMGDRSVWQALGDAESALSLAVRDHVEAAEKLPEAEARAVVKGACRAVAASPLAEVRPVDTWGLRRLAAAVDSMHQEIEGEEGKTA